MIHFRLNDKLHRGAVLKVPVERKGKMHQGRSTSIECLITCTYGASNRTEFKDGFENKLKYNV